MDNLEPMRAFRCSQVDRLTEPLYGGALQVSRKSKTGGATAAGRNRIRFDFKFDGVRYRPSLPKSPTEANLRGAREHVEGIRQRIASGIFSFAEEFPDFRRLKKVPEGGSPRTCAQVFDAFLKHCESRLAKNDLAAVTVASYRKILNGFWRPPIGTVRFLDVRYFDPRHNCGRCRLEQEDLQQRDQCSAARVQIRLSRSPREARSNFRPQEREDSKEGPPDQRSLHHSGG
ncbi:MAG: DUF3596 domain-containing protein [Steroidobacteraceae bacterium]